MNIKNTLCTFAGVGGAIVAGLLLKNSLTTKQSANVQAIISEPEECFAGIPLSKLTEVAKQIYHGLLAPGDHDHILSGVFNQFLSANPRASRINKKSANNPALID